MFFLLSKLFWLAIAPSHLLVWLMIAVAVLLYLNRLRPAKRLAIASAVFGVAIGVLPVGPWLMRAIENGYARPAYPAHVDGVLVLGGGQDTALFRSRGVIGTDEALPRLVATAELARRYPAARVVFAGGSGRPGDLQNSESGVAKVILLGLGVAPERLILEGKSRNTFENFTFAKALVKPKPHETWLLVSAAFHLPRATAIARRVGWTVVPWPANYYTSRGLGYRPDDILKNVNLTDQAVHELIGLAVYRISGKSA